MPFATKWWLCILRFEGSVRTTDVYVCSSIISPLPRDDMALHVLKCRLKRTNKRFCFECAAWISPTNGQWSEHCSGHLERLELFCGLRRLYKLPVLVPLCPFCLGDSTLRSEDRYQQFPTILNKDGYQQHLQRHFETLEDIPIACPHLICTDSFTNVNGLRRHFTNVHGISESSVFSVTRGRKTL